ncbi:MAG: universal stress protein [Chromatiales bacterium]|nr:universal stress protein [Chromatiales bacterium]
MLPEIKVILYATDLSVHAGHACRYAVYLAEKTDAEVHILHVAERLPADALDTLESYLGKFKDRKNFVDARLENAKQLLIERFDKFWDSLSEEERLLRSRIASLQVIESQPAETIIKYANEVNADMIVMGTHQKAPVQAFLGSISRRVLSTSKIPTLIIPIGYQPPP